MMNIKKKACAFALGAAVLGGSAYWAWHTYDSFNTAQENDLLLENIEALAVGEESGTLKYLNFHEKCVDEFGVPMDLSYAWRVISIEGATECHQHDCKKCNGQ